MSAVPTLHRSFQQHPFAQFDALHKAEPLLLALLALLAELLDELLLAMPLDEPVELLLAMPLDVPLALPVPDVDDADELLDEVFSMPPAPAEPLPLPPPEMPAKSSPVAQATMARQETMYQEEFFILAPWEPRRC